MMEHVKYDRGGADRGYDEENGFIEEDGLVLLREVGINIYTYFRGSRLAFNVIKALKENKKHWGDQKLLTKLIYDSIKGEDHPLASLVVFSREFRHADIYITLTVESFIVEDDNGGVYWKDTFEEVTTNKPIYV